MNIIVRKSWIAYVVPIFALTALSVCLYITLISPPLINEFVITPIYENFKIDSAYVRQGSFTILSILLLLIIRVIYKIFQLRSCKLTISDKGVYFESGVLPWTKESTFWSYRQIYQSIYRSKNQFFEWLFGFGKIVIVGMEGSTREYPISRMHKASKASSLINYRVQEINYSD